MNRWAVRAVPLSASCYDGDRLHLRLSGTETAVDAAVRHVGGEPLEDAVHFWESVREQRHGYFGGVAPLWRLSLPAAAAPLALPCKWLLEWGGAQRWLRGEVDEVTVRRAAQEAGGHASLFRGGDRDGECFQPLPPALQALHRRLKQAFDPGGIFNPGRLYGWC
jgi:glycolate oxidase FAD binding subunit